MGATGPAPLALGPLLKNAYLIAAQGWAELARRMDVEASAQPPPGAMERAPFYAMKLIPGDIGTVLGVRVDGTGITGGTYSGASIAIGPALTFSYIAARHAVSLAGR